VIDRVRDLGFDVIDINVGELPPAFPPAEPRPRLTVTGLHALLGGFLNARRDITSENARVRRAGVEFLRGVARLCEEVGAIDSWQTRKALPAIRLQRGGNR